MKISKLGERGLIKKIGKKVKIFSKDIVKGIGDDAAVLKFDKKKFLLLTTDTLNEGHHFTLEWFTPEQIGSKAIEINVSDIAAMGGFPKYCMVSLNLRKELDSKFVDRLYNGIIKSCKKYNISIIGGNISQAQQISVAVSMIGFVEKNRLCLRSNAKVGDLICVTDDLGKSKVGLELLRSNKKGKSIYYFLNPKSSLGVARKLSSLRIKTMEDISDGLASEVHNICKESKKGAIIYKEKLPLSKTTVNDSKKINKNHYDYALYGGEYLELIFTIPKSKLNLLKRRKIRHHIIGEIVDKNRGIYLSDRNKKYKLGQGYDHFKTNR